MAVKERATRDGLREAVMPVLDWAALSAAPGSVLAENVAALRAALGKDGPA